MTAPRRGDPAKIKESARKWREAHRAEKSEYNRRYRTEHREQIREYNRTYLAEWLPKNRHRVRAYQLKSKYGVTVEDYRAMLVGQAGRCLICLQVPDHNLHVDHDHATGAVRGLLCRDCNGLLGLSRDDSALLTRAARYLGATA